MKTFLNLLVFLTTFPIIYTPQLISVEEENKTTYFI